MVLRGVLATLLGAALLAGSGAWADEQNRDDYFSLDLKQALLSPKPLGPAAQFKLAAGAAKVDTTASAAPLRIAAPKPVRTIKVRSVRTAKRNLAVRTRLAGRHANPLDAQAFDARIQVWPCRSGGICNWRPQQK
jgi:hypothetical protein